MVLFGYEILGESNILQSNQNWLGKPQKKLLVARPPRGRQGVKTGPLRKRNLFPIEYLPKKNCLFLSKNWWNFFCGFPYGGPYTNEYRLVKGLKIGIKGSKDTRVLPKIPLVDGNSKHV